MTSAAESPGTFAGLRLHIVTGKGGTGKTTVAGALALALASQGKQVLLMEVEGRQGIAQLFDTAPLPYEERKVAVAPEGGDVYALAVDAEEALLEYLEEFYNLRRAGSMLRRMGAVDFATAIAPGLRDVLLTGKVKEAVIRIGKGRRQYDAVVLDAPPTGRIGRFLNVNAEIVGLAKVGPIKGQADSVMSVLRSPHTAIHIVTLLEEMPVQETGDAVAELLEISLPVGGIVLNMTREPALSKADLAAAAEGRLDVAELEAGLKEAGLPHDATTLDALVGEARDHAQRVALEHEERTSLADLERPTYELPLVHEGVDLGSLYELAALLREQGMV